MTRHKLQQAVWGIEFKESKQHRNWHFWGAFGVRSTAKDVAEDWFGKTDRPYRLVKFTRGRAR